MTLAALMLFSIQDTFSKLLAVTYHPLEIAFVRFLTMLVLILPFLLRRPGALRSNMPGRQLVRGLTMFGATTLFILGLSHLPIAEATAIGFVSPLFVTALSIPMLGETIGPRRWAAVVVGFIGVLVVIRPGTSAFQPAALFPIASSTFWALGIVLTRTMHGADKTLTILIYSTLIGFCVSGLTMPFVWRTPDLAALAMMTAQGTLSTIGQALMIAAFGRAGASVLAPFSYSQMLWATALGYAVFNTIPDTLTGIGSAIIIASGLYILHRERILQQRRALAAKARGPLTPP
ncbi:MAG: multidrug transporter permease [Rhodospirillales bacterium]|nr:multidrug transporter permease [Rhodospirillales bacterium]